MSDDLHIVFGLRGAGKSSFLAAKTEEIIRTRGDELLEFSKYLIDAENQGRKVKLKNYPRQAPIRTCNIKMRIPLRDGTYFEPLTIAGDRIGITQSEEEEYEYMHPASVLIIDEVQTVFNSKDQLKDGQLEFFTEIRHNDMVAWLGAPRGISAHKDIRAVCSDFFHILRFEEEFNPYHKRVKTTWHFRRFDSCYAFEDYVNANNDPAVGGFTEGTYEFFGDITKLYDGHAQRKRFMPPEGKDFAT